MKKGQSKNKERFIFFAQLENNPELMKSINGLQEFFGLSNKKVAEEALKLFVSKWGRGREVIEETAMAIEDSPPLSGLGPGSFKDQD